jgi:peptide deformylase
MAILKVARMGHPVLRQVSREVSPQEIPLPGFQQLLDDMIDTMYEYDGVGLAAPQVHQNLRVCVIDIREDEPRYSGKHPSGLCVFINPKLEALTTSTNQTWEGCLSVPGLRGLVSRPTKVRCTYLDREGKAHEFVAQGFLAIVLQHEFDHLDGVLYVDRIKEMKNLVFDQEFEKYILPNSKDEKLD